MNQLLFTTFNIYGGHSKFSAEMLLSEEYLGCRMDLFERYTFPSVTGQTRKDFRWYVVFDERTPEAVQERVNRLKELSSVFCPLFADISLTKELPGYIDREVLSKIEGRVVSTRCDNDDALAEDYLEEVYKAAQGCDPDHETAIAFENGLQYDENKKLMCDYRKWNNHFFSLCGTAGRDYLKPNCTRHEEIKERFKLELIKDTKPMWLEITHGGNTVNTCHLTRRTLTFDFDLLKRFKCDTDFPLKGKAFHLIKAVEGSVKTLL